MHSVEIVLDDDTDRQIRAQWHNLSLAGLPSQARHTGASNRPHITLALTATISAEVENSLVAVTVGPPIPVTLGPLLIFGSRRFVLARLVVPSAGLLELQAVVVRSLDDPLDPHRNFGPGRWTPHVTLARRLTADQIGPALTALDQVEPLSGQLVRLRRWDIEAKQESWLSSLE
jgi:2'-5' RNA ligase